MGLITFENEAEWSRIIGERLYVRRCERGLTQVQLSTALGISHHTISRYENGDTCPDSHTLYRIGRALSVDIGYFYASIRAAEHVQF